MLVLRGMDRREFLTSGLVLGAWPAAALAREPLALVTADEEAHVAEVSLATRRVRRRIGTIDGPRSIQSGRGAVALVGHSAAGAVSLLQGRPLRVRRVLRGFVQPRYGAFAPGGRYAFFSDSGSGEIAVIDLERGRVVRRVAVGAGARHLTLDPAGRRLWVALGSSAAAIAVVDVADPLRPRVLRVVRPPFLAHDVGFSPSGRRVWITGARERRIAIYSAGGRSPRVVQGADAAPQHITFGPALAYVASGEGRSVRAHSLTDGRLLRSARVPIGSYNVQFSGGRVLTPSLNMGTLTILDRHGRVAAGIRVARAAHDACAVS